MTLSIVAVLVLLIGLLLHAFTSGGSPPTWRGNSTLNELGRAMIWVGLFFMVAAMMGSHGNLVLR